jgi:hypothetical protein
MKEETIYWLVMRMRKWEDLFEPISGAIPIKVMTDYAGFIPIFKTRAEALEAYPDDDPVSIRAMEPPPVVKKSKRRKK